MCIYIYIMYIFIESLYYYYYVDIESGFRVSADLVLGMSYQLNLCLVLFRVSILGFGFGCI